MEIKIKINTENLKVFLARTNRPLNWLAEKIEVHPSYLSQMLYHKRNPSPDMRKRIIRAVKRTGDWHGATFDNIFVVERI